MKSLILVKTAQLLLPIIILFALYLLLRGHQLPGGGFSAGLVTTLAIVLQAFASGAEWTRSRLRGLLRPLLWLGLVIALTVALAPLLLGSPFLTHEHGYLALGEVQVPVSTTLLFDVGVYFTVLGTSTSILGAFVGERR